MDAGGEAEGLSGVEFGGGMSCARAQPPAPAWGSWRSLVGGGGVGQSVTAAGPGWLPGTSAPSVPAEPSSCSASATSQRYLVTLAWSWLHAKPRAL